MSYFASSDQLPEWARQIPRDWEKNWLKWNVSLSTARPNEDQRATLPYLSNEDIASWTGKLLREELEPHDADSRLFEPGDVLFNKLRPYLAKVFHADFAGTSSGELLCLRPSERVDARYLFYVLTSFGFIDAVDSHTFGSKMPRADWETVGHQPLPLPGIDAQQRIARFLDEKTARIDALIEKKQALLERLAEKRQALITRAVTKGMTQGVPMKASGVDWIGDIPEGWGIQPLRFLGSVILGLTYKPEDVSPSDQGVLVLRASNVSNGQLVHADDVFVETDIKDEIICREGDIVICSRNGSRHLIGKCGVVTKEWEGSTFGAFMTVVRSDIYEWLEFVLSSSLFEFQSGRYMSTTINQLTTSTLKSFPVPLPPEEEQKGLVRELRSQCDVLDRTVSSITKSIASLREYRSTLITAAVTGQLPELNG
jgi:type I restriction enzyme S subunit